MSDRFAQVIILAEDERSANLLRHYVQKTLSIGPRQLRQRISPSAKGDAKKWIIEQYPVEVRELRRTHSKRALVVHVDADVGAVAARVRQLAAVLKSAKYPPRRADERMTHAVPRRHTETWLCVLTGVKVDEDADCKYVLTNPDGVIKAAAEALFELTRPNADPAALPSLEAAVPELRRLET